MMQAVRMIIPSFPFLLEHLMKAEYLLLEELNFDLIVFSPYQSLSQYALDAKLGDKVDQLWGIISDSMKLTDLCLSFAPHMITLGAIFYLMISEELDLLTWFAGLNVDMQEVRISFTSQSQTMTLSRPDWIHCQLDGSC